MLKLTDYRGCGGNRVGEVGPPKTTDSVSDDRGVCGGTGEGGWGGEDAGNGDEVLVARHVTVQGLQRARCGARASDFETSDRGEVLNAAVALLSSGCFYLLKSILKVTWRRKQML